MSNKPQLPRNPFDPATYEGRFGKQTGDEIEKTQRRVVQLHDGRIAGVVALSAPPTGGLYAQGDVLRNSVPALTTSVSDTYWIWGWTRINEGAGTMTWSAMKMRQ